MHSTLSETEGESGEALVAMGWAIALQGGAGDITKNLPPERREPREAALRHCLQVGVAALKAQKSPLDVVELVVRICLHIHSFVCRNVHVSTLCCILKTIRVL